MQGHMNSKETAAYIGVSVNTLRKYVHEERLPVLRFPGRRKWVFRKDLVDEWVEKRSIPQIMNYEENNKPNQYGQLRIMRP
ncbi:helix-turn-helix domain-containing protein [Virgibacillus salexigens]|uniref:helix-turn-helix domain-containing protein n=1 Tax=Virgibacillus salexigens TaxID=61016 RepID=UPI00190AD02B|nr:helix-turn-helix domain-containing protein [Virgibacillus salexigens]